MKKEPVFGSEFEQKRPKMKKDKSFFAKLDNKDHNEGDEFVEKAVSQVRKELVEDSLSFNLPIGNQNKIR